MKFVIFTHANCADGSTAAMVMHDFLKDVHGPTAQIDVHFCNYGSDAHLREDVKDAVIYVTDFSFSREDLTVMAAQANQITVIDHHKTAQEALATYWHGRPANLNIIFDMNRSGAGLVWDWCQEAYAADGKTREPRPRLVNYVEDRDLWRFALADSKQANAYVANGDYSIDRFRKLMQEFDVNFDTVVAVGTALYTYQLTICRAATRNAQKCKASDGTVYVTANVANLISETGSQLLAIYDDAAFSATYFDRVCDNQRIVSLRARENDDVDVSAIAKRFPGGGGHKKAAGFQLPLNVPITF